MHPQAVEYTELNHQNILPLRTVTSVTVLVRRGMFNQHMQYQVRTGSFRSLRSHFEP